MISVIIPVYNEETMLRKNDIYYQMLSQTTELIFVDGGSDDATAVLAGKFGRVVKARKNRAAQMNAGAHVAKGKILLFLHADAVIHQNQLQKLEGIINKKEFIGGCLTQVLDDESLLFKWVAFTGNARAKITKVFYGDQAIFLRKSIFKRLKGFPEVNICEDILFSRKLRKAGKVDILPISVYCSARRWKQQGILKTFFLNARIKSALAFGVQPNQLKIAYDDVRE
ncbi:MAG: family 2 glycosyl transferase [Candidatus Omnitrophica bacterium CG11_big_fil_rev_8_21_14_0_20_42_13]|uniref:Family 2 glycosyl transferase n=1 Tax=Candidatus Ghiorseimicrobium undicola TaxID=1974746 RepID=A0A2H0LXM6_9BACT|nr:MAG: family 2 glycosyl transferase [Candidatus Omnitrophica bacterium CG11_big_fil_rev_8_21_14_0_20_42_13]